MSPDYPPTWPRAKDGSPLDLVYRALYAAGSQYAGGQDFQCPAHDDNNASLGVGPGRKVPVLFNCQAGCTSEVRDGKTFNSPALVLEALGLTYEQVGMGKANPASSTSPRGGKDGRSGGALASPNPAKDRPDAHRNVSTKSRTACGRTIAEHVKDDTPTRTRKWTYLNADREPTVIVRRRDYNCIDLAHRKHVDQIKVDGVAPRDAPYDLFRLPVVLQAVAAGRVVLVVEGEPSVDAARKAGEKGWVATTMRGGAGPGKWRPEYAKVLVGARKVIIVADRDETGEVHAKAVAASLDDVGVPWEIRQSRTEGAHDDLVEHLAAGFKVSELVVVSSSKADGAVDRGTLPWPPPIEPLEVAYRLVELDHSSPERERLRVFWRGDFYDWQTTHWRAISDLAVRTGAYLRLRDAVFSKVDGGLAPWSPDQGKVNRVLDALHSVCYQSEDREDGERGVVSFTNGLLDLSVRELKPHTPAFFNTSSLPFPYVREAAAPRRWLSFLESVWPGDVESVALLQEVLGYLVSGRGDFQKIPLIIGPTRSGKGTIASVVEALLGRANVCSPTLASLSGAFGLQPLIGRSVAVISDARFSGGKDQGVVVERLLSISGEDSLTVDRKNRDSWHGRLPTRFVIMSNESPQLRDSSGALAARMVMLRMTRSFLGREDYRLKADLTSELTGILAWALDGYDRLVEQGHFTEPRASRDIVREMLRLTSPVTAFVQDVCVLELRAEVVKADLWHEWRAWAQSNGQFEGSAEAFGRNLTNAFSSLVRVGRTRDSNSGGKRVHTYVGIRVVRDRDR